MKIADKSQRYTLYQSKSIVLFDFLNEFIGVV